MHKGPTVETAIDVLRMEVNTDRIGPRGQYFGSCHLPGYG